MSTLKYLNTQVVFQEVPDEIALAVNITNCPIRCPDCHSKFLWEDVGIRLDEKELTRLMIFDRENPRIHSWDERAKIII